MGDVGGGGEGEPACHVLVPACEALRLGGHHDLGVGGESRGCNCFLSLHVRRNAQNLTSNTTTTTTRIEQEEEEGEKFGDVGGRNYSNSNYFSSGLPRIGQSQQHRKWPSALFVIQANKYFSERLL